MIKRFDVTGPAEVRPGDPLAELAEAINAAHQEGLADVHRGLSHFRAAGEKLIQAKAACPRGQWLAWLESNVGFSERRAQRYMALAKYDTGVVLEDAWEEICGKAVPDPDLPPEDGSEDPVWAERAKKFKEFVLVSELDRLLKNAKKLRRDLGELCKNPAAECVRDYLAADVTPLVERLAEARSKVRQPRAGRR